MRDAIPRYWESANARRQVRALGEWPTNPGSHRRCEISSHQLSQNEIASDNPVLDIFLLFIVLLRLRCNITLELGLKEIGLSAFYTQPLVVTRCPDTWQGCGE